MTQGILQALGGLGVFLFGLRAMTEGLRALAGGALGRTLRRFTGSPSTGALTGAVTTAVVQSSSATTVTAVGLVGAGMLTFPHALGIVFGANAGTTVTGWMVALFGFKIALGTVLLPGILVGALLELLGRGRARSAGRALAGLALLFLGLELLKTGMEGFGESVTPESFPPDTWAGRGWLVGIGVLVTLVTQSSSAGVATAIAAIHTGTIGFAQAGALVIGMDVGTTVTAALATIGGSTAVRRTGLAHVVYNLFTGAGAFLLLPLYAWALQRWAAEFLAGEPELALVAFHTAFNLLGVLAVLPFASGFARLVMRLVPERGPRWTRALDRAVAHDPGLAGEALRTSLHATGAEALRVVAPLLVTPPSRERAAERVRELEGALQETHRFLELLGAAEAGPGEVAVQQRAIHVLDHLERMLARFAARVPTEAAREDPRLREAAEAVARAFADADDPADPGAEARLRESWAALDAQEEEYRRSVLAEATRRGDDPESALDRLDEMRRLRRLAYHAWRVAHHLGRLDAAAEGHSAPDEPLP